MSAAKERVASRWPSSELSPLQLFEENRTTENGGGFLTEGEDHCCSISISTSYSDSVPFSSIPMSNVLAMKLTPKIP